MRSVVKVFKMKKEITNCLYCGKETTNKEFCSGECRKKHNIFHTECGSEKRSFRGLRA